MTIPTFHLPDMVDVYDAPTQNNVGIYSGGTTIVAGSALVALLPLSQEEAMTIGGSYDRTRIRLLAEPTLDLQANAKIIVGTSALWPQGKTFGVEGAPQKWPDPINPAAAFMLEAILVERQ